MYISIFLTHLMFGLFLFVVSASVSWFILRHPRILDTPNQRSSHLQPTPTTGGVAIVLTFFLGMGIFFLIGDAAMIQTRFFFGFTFSSILVAAMSLYDDYKDKPFWLRLATQALATLVIMFFGIVITRIDLPFLQPSFMAIAGWFFTFFWIVGLTNAYNFMDGLNGMAGGNAVVAAVCLAWIAFSQGSNFTYVVCYCLAAGTAGFLVFNFPEGRLFMGDVGATFLGFAFASLAVVASLYDNAHTSLLVVPLLLFHFIFDTAFTFTRRLINRENVFQAHRTHLYQLLNRMGWSHTRVTLLYCTLGIIQGLGAFWMVQIPSLPRLLVFIPFLILYTLFAARVTRQAKKQGLL
jgi:UDP-GlcNAc:undecaprenyl-phosphate/decaprenyl-phosphate GlcNAc-1-phosphate transferase